MDKYYYLNNKINVNVLFSVVEKLLKIINTLSLKIYNMAMELEKKRI